MNHRMKRRKQKGASAVEAALMLPLMIIVTFGAVDIAQYINSGQVISNASREGARIASRADTETVQQVEDAILDYLAGTIPQLSEQELEDAVTIQVREFEETTTEEDGVETTTRTYTAIQGGDLSNVESGDGISVSVEFDYAAIRWMSGPGFPDQEIETICRRQ